MPFNDYIPSILFIAFLYSRSNSDNKTASITRTLLHPAQMHIHLNSWSVNKQMNMGKKKRNDEAKETEKMKKNKISNEREEKK